MKKNTGLRRRTALGMAALMLFALLGALLPMRAGAADYTVTGDAASGYTANGGTVYPIHAVAVDTGYAWTVKSAAADGNTYQDSSGTFYAPAGAAVTAVLTYTAVLLPTETLSVTDSGGSTVTASTPTYPSDGESDLSCTYTMAATASDLTVASALVQADAAPVNGVAAANGQKYALSNGIYVPCIAVTFSSSSEYSVYTTGTVLAYGDNGTYYITPSTALGFTLSGGSGYTFPSPPTAALVQGCTVGGTAVDVATLNLTASDPQLSGTLPASALTADAAVSFTMDTTQLTKLVGVTPLSGAGYTLTVLQAATPGIADTQLVVGMKLDAAYSNSTPSLSASGYTVNAMSGATGADYPGYDWVFYIAADTGTTFPASGDLAVTISGVTPNSTGGDSSDPVQNKIRVENELNQTDVSSDTTLWPSGTTETNGVSTTVVSDAELQALLDLAAKHAEDTEKLGGTGLKEGIFCIEDLSALSSNTTYILSLTDPQFETLAQADWDRLTMQTPAGSFSLYPGTVQQTAELAGNGGSGGVQMELKRLEYSGRPGIEATLLVNSTEVTVLDETYGVRIFLPYVPTAGEDLNALVIEYIHEDGTAETVTECSYDEEMGGLIFFVGHLSKFGVAYRPATFTDVGPNQWANPYVTFLVSRGIISGSSGGKYRPDDAATRGEFLAVVTRALSAAKLPATATKTYSDVAANSYVAKAANWVYYNNLAGDITSGGKLQPGAAITRQEAALLVSNVAEGMGLRVRARGFDTDYADAGQIAAYAKKPVARLRAAGLLDMPQNRKFSPASTLNRGEMAQLIATLLSNL